MIYRFYHIPGVTPRDIINKKLSDMPGFFRQVSVTAEARGPEITVDFVDTTDPHVRTLGTTTHICTTPNTENTGIWSTWYRVTSVIEIAPATSTQGRTWRLTATLAALQTVVTNSLETWTADGVTRRLIDAQRWELTQAGVRDFCQYGQGVVSGARRIRELAGTLEFSNLNDMCVIVTAFPSAIDGTTEQIAAAGGYQNGAPQSYVLTSNSDIEYGQAALGHVGVLLTDTAVRNFIYRVQLLPYSSIIQHMTLGTEVLFKRSPDVTPQGARRISAYEYPFNSLVVSLDAFRQSGIAYKNAYANPQISFEYGGNVLARFDVFNHETDSTTLTNVSVQLGVACSMGVNFYAKFVRNNVVLGYASLPIPEVMGSSDGSLHWYETTGRNLTASAWQSTGQTAAMTGSGVALGLIAGGPIGAAVGAAVGAGVSIASTWATTERQLELGAQQARQTLETVGIGPSNLFAQSPNTAKLCAFFDRIPASEVSRLDRYFRRHGYTGAWTRDNLTTLDRQNFESFAGSGTFSIWADQAPDVTVDYNDLHDRANAELSGGVTVWSTSSIGNYSVSNDPVN